MDGFIFLLLNTCIILLAVFSKTAGDGARAGIHLCTDVIFPSLLPMLILTGTLTKSRASLVAEKLFGRATQALLRLPKACAPVILFGLIGGYPAGTVLTAGLYRQGSITEQDARRLLGFNVCGGVGFIISAVGTVRLQSTALGLLLFAASAVSSLLIALVSAGFYKKPVSARYHNDRLPLADALMNSAEDAAKSLIGMSVYIVLFSAFVAVIPLPAFLLPLFEITNGVCAADITIPLPYLSFFLTFGGFCIHFQLLPLLKEMHISYSYFLLHRIGGAVLSCGITALLLRLFPATQTVFSNIAAPTNGQFAQINSLLSISMIVGCAVLVADVKNKKLKLL